MFPENDNKGKFKSKIINKNWLLIFISLINKKEDG